MSRTVRTHKSLGPFYQAQILKTCLICGKHILKLYHIYRIHHHSLLAYINYLVVLSGYPCFLIESVAIHDEKNNVQLNNKEDSTSEDLNHITEVLPEEILWIRLDTGIIEGVEIKSY